MPWDAGASWNIGTTLSLWGRVGASGLLNGVFTTESNSSTLVSQAGWDAAGACYDQNKDDAHEGLQGLSKVPGAGKVAERVIECLPPRRTAAFDPLGNRPNPRGRIALKDSQIGIMNGGVLLAAEATPRRCDRIKYKPPSRRSCRGCRIIPGLGRRDSEPRSIKTSSKRLWIKPELRKRTG